MHVHFGGGVELIEENRDKVEAMAKALLELETIDSDQLGDIMSGQPPRPPKPVPAPTPGTTIGPGTVGGTAPTTSPARSRLDL
jgi:cell division protease FtsH